jgi:hypothetical protein
MKLGRIVPFALLLTCVWVSTLGAQNAIVENPYYPVKLNTTWTYKLSDGKQLIMKVTKHEKVGNTVCARVESSVDGKVIASEHIGVTSEGICRFQIGENPATPPLCFLKLPFSTTAWKVDSNIKGEVLKGSFTPGKEEVTVPFGKFSAVTAATTDLEVNMIKVGTTYYFAKDIGMVKQVIKLGDKQTIVLELEKYEPGK